MQGLPKQNSPHKAPVVLFAFNRAETLRNTVASLQQNEETRDTDLFVFVDGARKAKEGEEQKVKEVREYVETISGFRRVAYTFSEENKGLAPSVIMGVTKIINQYGRAIVIEDDLVLSANFLSFMNQALSLYEKDGRVFSVCGYSNKVKVPRGYSFDAYFCTRSSSWGWGTWADRWNSVDWELKDWESHKKNARAFNKWGGSDCFGMLDGWKHGRNSSWAIRFCYNQFLQQKLSLFPIISKVKNNGFDGAGTNCRKWNRFKCVFDGTEKKTFFFPKSMVIDRHLYDSAMSYHTIPIRMWSKIMYMIYG